MSKATRYILLGFAAAFLAMLFEPFWSSLLLLFGVDTAGYAKPVVDWIRSALSLTWFQPIAFLVVGLAGGVWLDAIVRTIDRARVTPMSLSFESEIADLGQLRRYFAGRQKALDDHTIGSKRPMDDLRRFAEEYESVLTTLEKRGLTVPRLDWRVDPIGYVDMAVEYADRVTPLLKRGHIDEAKSASSEQTTKSYGYQANRRRL